MLPEPLWHIVLQLASCKVAEDKLDPLEDPEVVLLPLLIPVDDHWLLLILTLLLPHISIRLKHPMIPYSKTRCTIL